jgi:NADP-dependent 3-hydroxy acid dehydrogenase YdfG
VFAAEGAKVIAGARRESELEELVSQIRAAGGEVAAMAGGVLVRKDMDRCGRSLGKPSGKVVASCRS